MKACHRVMSFNINGDHNEGENAWGCRARLAMSVVHRYRPDIIGVQECAEGNLATFAERVGGRSEWC